MITPSVIDHPEDKRSDGVDGGLRSSRFNIETDVRDVWFMTIMLWRCRRRVAERREVGGRDLARPAMKRRMYWRTKVMHDKIAKERRIPRRKVLN